MKIHVLQHVSFEGPAQIAKWAEERAHTLEITRLYNGDPLPVVASGDALVIMGGPMSVHDVKDYPWLRDEMNFVRNEISRGTKTLGVCLGSQIIAEAMGGRVYRNSEKEIGWFPVIRRQMTVFNTLPLPERMTVFHWHGETYDLPPEAELIFSSDGCANQGFIIGPAVGLQFHLEMDRESVEGIVANCGNELVSGKYIRCADDIISGETLYAREGRAFLFDLLDRAFAL